MSVSVLGIDLGKNTCSVAVQAGKVGHIRSPLRHAIVTVRAETPPERGKRGTAPRAQRVERGPSAARETPKSWPMIIILNRIADRAADGMDRLGSTPGHRRIPGDCGWHRVF